MNITPQQTEKLLKGNLSFSQLGFSMLLTRLKIMYASNPSQATLLTCANEINAFLVKFKSIMGNDYTVVAKL